MKNNTPIEEKSIQQRIKEIRERGNMTKALTQPPSSVGYTKEVTYPDPKAVTITIPPEIHAEIMYYVNKSSVEISGLGRIVRDSRGNMVVSKIYLIDQENSAASTDLSEDAVSKLLFETRKDEGAMNFWWHSHVNMGVFWSGTDLSTISQFGRNGYLVATVFNKKGEMRSAYYQGAGEFLPEVFVDNIQTNISFVPKKDSVDEWDKLFKEKCKTKSWGNYHHSTGMTHFGWDDDESYDDYGGYKPRYGNTAHGLVGKLQSGNVSAQKPEKTKEVAVEEDNPYITGPATKKNVSELWDEFFKIVSKTTDFAALDFEEFDVMSDVWCFLHLSVTEPSRYDWTLESLSEMFAYYVKDRESVHQLMEDLSLAEDMLLDGKTAEDLDILGMEFVEQK